MWANPFQVATASHVSAYRVAVRGGTANATFSLSLWSGATEPAALIEGNINSAVLDGTQQILTLNSPTLPALDPSLTYWLVMEASDPVADTLYWYRNDIPGAFRKRAFTGSAWGVGFQGSDVFEVQGTAGTPEPATALLVAAALFCAARRRRT
ncbi:MAG: PEP-CTERM sorting domain-containing protein [Acidobacteria bacterium]|nr:PEP-CTERM sorting domain-containing protein [Acidobacteriota bacterium]